MHRIFWCVLAAAALSLTGCAGVPLMTALKISAINPRDIIEGDSTKIMVALNVDANISAARTKRPALRVQARPDVPGDYEPFDRRLEFELSGLAPQTLGLGTPAQTRTWLVYGLSAKAVKDMRDFQAYIVEGRNRTEKKGGGRLNIVLENEWLMEQYPQYAGTDVQVWLQFNAKDGFLKFWSGRLAQTRQT